MALSRRAVVLAVIAAALAVGARWGVVPVTSVSLALRGAWAVLRAAGQLLGPVWVSVLWATDMLVPEPAFVVSVVDATKKMAGTLLSGAGLVAMYLVGDVAFKELFNRFFILYVVPPGEVHKMLLSQMQCLLADAVDLSAGGKRKDAYARRFFPLPDLLHEAALLQRQMSNEGSAQELGDSPDDLPALVKSPSLRRQATDEAKAMSAQTSQPTDRQPSHAMKLAASAAMKRFVKQDHYPVYGNLPKNREFRVHFDLGPELGKVGCWCTLSSDDGGGRRKRRGRNARRPNNASLPPGFGGSTDGESDALKHCTLRMRMWRADAPLLPEILRQARAASAAEYFAKTPIYRCRVRGLREMAEIRSRNNPQRLLKRWEAHPETAPAIKASWDREPEMLTKLPPSSFVWPEGDDGCGLDQLITEAKDFMASQKWYIERGIPYRKGFLLHGKPRSGKTHFARMLAGVLGCALYVLDLGSESGITDQNLPGLMRAMRSRSILLIKNIDAFVSSRKLTGVSSELTFSGLLNVLDGALGNTDGALVLLTSNRLADLQRDRKSADALLRPGRVDRKAAFGFPTTTQCERYFVWLFTGCAADADVRKAATDFLEIWPSEVPADGGPARSMMSFAELKGYLSRFLRAGNYSEAARNVLEVDKFRRETGLSDCVAAATDARQALVAMAKQPVMADDLLDLTLGEAIASRDRLAGVEKRATAIPGVDNETSLVKALNELRAVLAEFDAAIDKLAAGTKGQALGESPEAKVPEPTPPAPPAPDAEAWSEAGSRSGGV